MAGAKKSRPHASPSRIRAAAAAAPSPAPRGAAANGEPPSHVVGIGASAGGLEAFEAFFRALPARTGMAFVLVPHLDPTHKSILPEIIGRSTRMKVATAESGARVEADRVYVIPPNRDLSILNGTLELLEPRAVRGVRHSIDFFFRALAQDQKERAVCIVLSGTGTEGTLGLRAVKGEGGLVLVQDPGTAKYEGMPGSALATGLADYVLAPQGMPEALLRYARRSPAPPRKREAPAAHPAEHLRKIFLLVRAQTGHDFSLYKPNTVLRRIERRMAIHQVDSLADYAAYLRANPHEIEELFKELLIRVTNFFRDPEAFELLKEKVIPQILKGRGGRPVRVWVPGCSTGEEAYSIAIVFREALQKARARGKVQIFGTDIDAGAIETARTGIYPDIIGADVSPERLGRFFVKAGSTYKVREDLREMLVFAAQNLVKDPPFSKLDLISCRNVLIYLGGELQRRVVPLFHYALSPEGFLLLGPSESIGESGHLFRAVDKKWKVFRARRGESPPALPPHLRHAFPEDTHRRRAGEPAPAAPGSLGEATERLLVERFSPPAALVNERGDILYLHGRTGSYLEPAPGKAALNILDMAREGLRLELRSALRKALGAKVEVVVEGVQVRTNGGYEPVTVRLRTLRAPEHLQGLVLVSFHEAAAAQPRRPARGRARGGTPSEARVRELESELDSTREHLQAMVEELETSNEELQSSNEELQSSNEELQSSNEELETSKEELQSVNEELVTVNAELQNKIEEISQTNNDMNNLLASTQIATVFLDRALRIKRYTPHMDQVFNLIPGDVGRPISDIVSKLDYPGLVHDAGEVLRSLATVESVIHGTAGGVFLTRIIPYRTSGDVIDGVVITFINVTEQRVARELTRARGIIEGLPRALAALEPGLRIVLANRAFRELVRIDPVPVTGVPLAQIGGGVFDEAGLVRGLRRMAAGGGPVRALALEREIEGLGRRRLRVDAVRIEAPEGEELLLLAVDDVTPVGTA